MSTAIAVPVHMYFSVQQMPVPVQMPMPMMGEHSCNNLEMTVGRTVLAHSRLEATACACN